MSAKKNLRNMTHLIFIFFMKNKKKIKKGDKKS